MGVRFVRAAMVILIIGSGVSGFALAQVFAVEENGIISTKKKVEIPQGMEEEWEGFKGRYGDAFTSVEWDSVCGCVRRIYGYYDTGRGELKSEADAEALARDFLTENAGLFKIDMSALKVKRLRQNKKFGYWDIEYIQTYNGIPVYRGEVGITLSNNSIIKSLGNNFYPDINISIEPKITKEEAIRIAENEVKGYRRVESVELYILPQMKDGKLEYRLTWRTYFKGAYFFIDAVNGEIIHKEYTVVADGGISAEGAVNDKITNKKDTAVATPAQNEGSVNSSSAIFVGLAALAIATTLIIIWRYRK